MTIKKIASKTWGLFIGTLIFLIILFISMAKGAGVLKALVLPAYNNFDFTINDWITYPLFILSIYAFYWIIKKDWVKKRKKTFGYAFGIGVSLILLIQSPYLSFYQNLAGRTFGFIGVNSSESYLKNEIIRNITGSYGFDVKQVPALVEKIGTDNIEPMMYDYIAFACEINFTKEGDQCAKKYWSLSLKDIKGEDFIERSQIMRDRYFNVFGNLLQNYKKHDFKTKENMEIVKFMMLEGMINRFDINDEIDYPQSSLTYNGIYELVKKYDFKYAEYFINKEIPKSEFRDSLKDYFTVK